MSAPPLRIEPLAGDALRARLGDLARLRIEVFRDFPYLYEGSLDYEARYLDTYVRSLGSVIVAAMEGSTIVGAATGVPLVHEPEYVSSPLQNAGLDVSRIFYFGESVLRKDYRGRGVGISFFSSREAHARALGIYTHAVFCGVERPTDHPRRPPDYVPLDAFWEKRGYCRLGSVKAFFSWRDVGDEAETAKPMQFWIKEITA